MESVPWKAAYAVFAAVEVGFFGCFVTGFLNSLERKGSVVKILFGFGKAA